MGFLDPNDISYIIENLNQSRIPGNFPNLIIDTQFFDPHFTHQILDSLENLDDQCKGVLIHSENFQALNLLRKNYQEKIKCIYIDPPYNTSSSSIPYKNNYKHSSWGTMIYDRLAVMKNLLSEDGAIFVSIDKTERSILEYALESVFGTENKVEELIWSMNTNNSQAPNYSTNHEYVEVFAKNRKLAEQDRNMFREPKPGFEEVMALVKELNPKYPSTQEIEQAIKSLYEQHKIAFREEIEAEGLEWDNEKSNDPWKGLYNYNKAEYRNTQGQLLTEIEAHAQGGQIWVWREDNTSMPATKQATSTREPGHPNWRFYKPLHPQTGKPSPHPKSGWKFAYNDDVDSPDRRSFVSLDRDSRIVWGLDEKKVPQIKRFLHEVETNVGKSVFQDYSDGEKQTSAMFGESGVFLAPKQANFVSRFILHAAKSDSTILDCFGGSGSTAHAVIKLNREDKGTRKFVTAEMGAYFDSVTKPRIIKAIYSNEWKNGKPVSHSAGNSFCLKYFRLETYEDALNNLTLESAPANLLDMMDAEAKEDYMLHYKLEFETQGSPSLLDLDAFVDPTAYSLKIRLPGSDESRMMNVDLLETFNYLLGLHVQHIAVPQTFSADFQRDGQGRLKLDGKTLKSDPKGLWWFRSVTGTLPDGRKTLIVWRKRPGGESLEGLEQDNLVLSLWFNKQGYSAQDSEFEVIYINGSHNLELSQDRTKIKLIEEDFQRLMFDVQDV